MVDTLPKFNMEPENGWFPRGTSFSGDFFSGSMLNFGGVDMIYRYLDLPKGAKWFRFRVSIHHPLGFKWHPLEAAGKNVLFIICG